MKNLTVYLSTLIIVGFLALFSCKKETQTFDPKITSNPSEFEFYETPRDSETDEETITITETGTPVQITINAISGDLWQEDPSCYLTDEEIRN